MTIKEIKKELKRIVDIWSDIDNQVGKDAIRTTQIKEFIKEIKN